MKQISKLVMTLLFGASLLLSPVPSYSKGSSSSGSRSSSSSSSSRSSSSSSSNRFQSSSRPSGGNTATKPSTNFSSSSKPAVVVPKTPATNSGGFKSSSKPGVSSTTTPNNTSQAQRFSSSSKPAGSTVNPTTTTSSAASRVNQAAALAPTKSKEQFMQDFKAQNAAKYQTKFTSQPSVRPSYIPAATMVGNSSYPVVYNSSLGTYGYYGGFADTFVPYDPFPSLVTSAYSGYLISNRPTTYVATSRTSGWTILFIFFLFGGVIAASVFWFKNKN